MDKLSNNLIVKHNDLIMASYEMTVHEQNVLFACISQLDSRAGAKAITDQDTYTITVEQARDLFYNAGDQRHAYRDLEFASRNLFERKVEISLTNNEVLLTRFVQSIKFKPDAGCIELRFATEILPYLTQLQNNFTQYRMGQVVQLTSMHARRLFELIVCWAGQQQNKQEFELDEFRKLMNVGGKYKQFGQLKDKVINTAIDQINENSDWHVSVGYRKVMRSFKYIQLEYHRKQKPQEAPAPNRDQDTPDFFDGKTDRERGLGYVPIDKPLTKAQADSFAGRITMHCDKNPQAGYVHVLGGQMSAGFSCWYEAKDTVHRELQEEETYKKYIPVLNQIGFKQLEKKENVNE